MPNVIRLLAYAPATVWVFCLLVTSIALAEAPGDARLPNGTQFTFWEKPLSFSTTYYVDGSSPASDDRGPGTRDRPFRSIGRAAEVLQPGERVVIAAGVYRECVRPARGGSGPEKMISYEAAPGAAVIVKASEVLRDWQPSGEPLRDGGDRPVRVWKHELSGTLFPDAYNPFALANVPGDWSWLDTRSVDMGPYFRRRGMIFANGMPLEPVEQYRELGNVPLPPNSPPRGGLPQRSRGGPIMQEIGGSAEARFWVEHQGNVVHIRVPSGDPARSLIEITAREQGFAPLQSGLGYIRVKGLVFQQAGNGFPPPQRGLVSTSGGHHWVIEGNTIEWATGVGLDIGAQHWRGPRDPQAGASNIVRGNTIRYIGVEGIAGMGTSNTLIEDNLIEWVGWQDAERAWEAAGVKLHRARNLLFRRNVIRHIRHANALWLDSDNRNSRITANVFADILTVSAAVHMEMNREANQIDDNIIWDVRNAEPGTPGQRGCAGSGIFDNATDNLIIAQNLIGRCDNAGIFAIIRQDRNKAIHSTGHNVANNIFAKCKSAINFLTTDNRADGNVYVDMPEQFQALFEGAPPPDYDPNAWTHLKLYDLAAWRALKGWDKNSVIADAQIAFNPDTLELTITSSKPLPRVGAVNQIQSDMLGKAAGSRRVPGPLANPGAKSSWQMDPRLFV